MTKFPDNFQTQNPETRRWYPPRDMGAIVTRLYRKRQAQRNFIISLVPFLLLVFCSLSTAGTSTIIIHKSSLVNEKMIHLGDISQIKGENLHLNQKLSSIVIGRSPLPSNSRYIDKEYIEVRLRQNKINPSGVKVHYPEKIEVCRDYLRVSKGKITEIMRNYIFKEIPWDRDTVKIKRINVSSDLVLPKGDVTYEVTPLKYWNFVGSKSIPVIFRINDAYKKKIWVGVEIEVLTDVVVSSKRLNRYRIASKEDLRLEKRDMARVPRNVITKLEEVVGKRIKRRIDVGSIITADLLDLPPVIRRGDMVTITVETDILKITTLGEARKNGLEGEMIKVLNIASRKEVYGIVMDPKTVKIEF